MAEFQQSRESSNHGKEGQSEVPPRIRREDLKEGEVLCSYCTAKCCRYFALGIDAPTKWNDFDNMRWYMMHGPVCIFVDDGCWFLMVIADCQHLLPDQRCGAYETRPQICRVYTTDNCEYDEDGVYDQYFETPEQLWEYAHAVMPPRPRRTVGEPVHLPLLTGI
ncbi:MAG: YkgJ family cysteine cluster protein [Planctomyces sp.]|nr:YkgJ family cysteine cluster protein [Planctomyces sp.]